MHGVSSGSTLLVNAEVDSMGGVIDGGGGIGTKTSPRRIAFEKAQAELRLEYDVRQERSRELEFLEKGGNPLDFKFEHAASLSIHSTSCAGQNPDQIVNSEAKYSFALTASPQGERGDSVESSGRLGVTVACEPNSADNFDGDHELLENDRKSVYPSRSNITASGHSSQLDRSQNVKELEDSSIFHHKKGQAYRRRNRSRVNRDGARSSAADLQSRSGDAYSLPSRHAVVSGATPSDSQLGAALDGACAVNSTADPTNGAIPEGKLEASSSKDFQNILLDASGKSDKTPTTGEPDFGGEDHEAAGCVDCPCSTREEIENDGNEPLDELGKLKGDRTDVPAEAIVSNVVSVTKGLDSESSCTHTSDIADGSKIIDSDICNLNSENNNRAPEECIIVAVEKSDNKDDKIGMDKDSFKVNEQNDQINGFINIDKDHRCPVQSELKRLSNTEENNPDSKSEQDVKFKNTFSEQPEVPRDLPFLENMETRVSCSTLALEVATYKEDQPKAVDEDHENRILEEAQIIEAKRKRIAQLSICTLPKEFRRKSEWDFVLEEMAWLANDFAQERLWKITSAAQLSQQAAFASRLRLAERRKWGKQNVVANTLVKAVMEFWQKAALLVSNLGLDRCKDETVPSRKSNEAETASGRIHIHQKELQLEKNQAHGVQGYAVRFLQYNSITSDLIKVEASAIPEQTSDIEMLETSWQDQFTEENLFYTVPPGVMEAYRKSIEHHLEQFERTNNNVQGEVDMPMCDAVAEFGSQENEYEEYDRENLYYLPATFDGGRAIRFAPRKRKNMKAYAARSYESGVDLPHGHCAENRIGTPQSMFTGKRPANSLNVALIPTRRVRTASRQRVVGPSYGGSAGFMPARSRNDASSGDTDSFQDDQSSLHGGSIIPKCSEVDSGMDFDKQFTYDFAEVSAKPRKKKKTKHQGTTSDNRWQIDSTLKSDQKDQLKRRLDNHQFDSNGSGLFGHFAKKPKVMKQSLDNSYEHATPIGGSIASPVTSQMNNFSNPSKLIKLISGRDRSRKAKTLKVPMGQPGSGSPWSLFEDQALVVLVHDMGPNWELVSNAINSTLHFKCVFRKPKECKERHKALMDRTSGDGADSADDSGSSQPYPSTLPGIPKGSAMQLFQRLQGPMEEDAIKSHFEKIILIGQQLHNCRKKNDAQDMKQLAPVHGSHVAALSQVVPNNVNGAVLTPLDLCDTGASSPDFLTLGGYQGSFSGSLALSHQVSPSLLPSSGASSSIQGSSSKGIGGSITSPSAQINGSIRYSAPRGNLPTDDQQRMQQCNMLPNRNVQQSSGTGTGFFPGTDHSVRMLPGGGGMGIMCGMNRSMPRSRPGFQGIPSSSMHSGHMAAPNIGMPGTMKVQPRVGAGQGNSVKAHGTSHAVGIGQTSEQQRQMMSPDMHIQATQTCSHGVPPFGGMSSTSPNQSSSPPVQPYATNQQQHPISQQRPNVLSNSHHSHLQRSSHPAPQDQQAYAARLVRDRQIQQRKLQLRQQQQQFPASSAPMSQLPTPNQLPVSSSLQHNTQIQSHGAPQPVPSSPVAPPSSMTPAASVQQQKHQLPPEGFGRNSQGVASRMMTQVEKQRLQCQQLQPQHQQSGRHHPQLRPQSQQSKLLKGVGRGNVLVHSSLPADDSHHNGLSGHLHNPVAEKGEQTMHMRQAQGLYSVSGQKASKPLLSAQPSCQSHPQQKQYSTVAPAPSQVVQQMPSHPDSSNLSQVQPKPPAKSVNHSQPTKQRVIQQNHISTVDPLTKFRSDQAQVDSQSAKHLSITSATPSCLDSTNVIPLVSSANTANWRASESLSHLVIENSSTQISSTGIPPPASSPESEILPSNGYAQSQRELLGSLPSQGKNVGTQWQQLSPKQSQQQQEVEQLPQRQQLQPPQQQIQAGQSSTLTRITNSRLE